jgi:hypothetical protein
MMALDILIALGVAVPCAICWFLGYKAGQMSK